MRKNTSKIGKILNVLYKIVKIFVIIFRYLGLVVVGVVIGFFLAGKKYLNPIRKLEKKRLRNEIKKEEEIKRAKRKKSRKKRIQDIRKLLKELR